MEFESGAQRRLPVYVLLDTSGSMAGAPIEQVNQGVMGMVNELQNSPQAMETVWLSVITFGSEARQIIRLTELAKFRLPTLSASGPTPLGAALKLLNDSLDQDVVQNSDERKGDFKPIILVLLGSDPTDDFEAAAASLTSRGYAKPAAFVVVVAGDDVLMPRIQATGATVVTLRDHTGDSLLQSFRWVTQTIRPREARDQFNNVGGRSMDFESGAQRRLPVYLLLDTSGSMAGAPIEQVNQGVMVMVNELQNSPQAMETVWLSVITFGSEARQIIPLTELAKFKPPTLSASGSTPLGAALKLLNDSLDRDIVQNSPERKGDFKPLMFLFTDGEPTDEWGAQSLALKSRTQKKLASIITLGAGDGVNVETLRAISDTPPLLIRDITGDNILTAFKWVTQSMKVASTSAAGGREGVANLPPPPQVIQVVL